MKKKIITIISILILALGICTGCAHLEREIKDVGSDFAGGLNRIITVYTADGNIIAQYKGRIDLEKTDGGYVKFDYKGKRYMYYNCFVEAIEVDE